MNYIYLEKFEQRRAHRYEKTRYDITTPPTHMY